jgi:hypothetical protein
MKTHVHRLHKDPSEPPGDVPDASLYDGPVDPETIARSDANILRWKEYLPEDCIATMIAMKWDLTT